MIRLTQKGIKRFFIRMAVFIFLLMGFMALAGYILMPQLTRCVFVSYNDDFIEKEGIYISKGTPDWVQDSLLSMVTKAKERNEAFWEERKGEPILIFCYKKWRFDRMGVAGKPASTWLSLAGAYVVLGPSAFNLDIISHELCHAELLAQVGWLARDNEIPTWFDEGLAMQLDHRSRYAEKNLKRFGADLLQQNDVQLLNGPEEFWSENNDITRLRYILAKQTVHEWLGANPKEKLGLFCSKLRNGVSFEKAFNS